MSSKSKIVKEKFYTYKNRRGEEQITVCLLLDSIGNTARGISCCSNDEDKFDREEGKKRSKYYAEVAIKNRKAAKHYTFKDKRSINILLWCRCPWKKKCEKNPELAFFERKILYGKNWQSHHKFNTVVKPISLGNKFNCYIPPFPIVEYT